MPRTEVRDTFFKSFVYSEIHVVPRFVTGPALAVYVEGCWASAIHVYKYQETLTLVTHR
jgi:hypothetical protein